MSDYTRLKKEAQAVFTGMLEKCEKEIDNFYKYSIDPKLYFTKAVKFFGKCKYQVRDGYRYKKLESPRILLSDIVLPSTEYVWKNTLAHEIAHAMTRGDKHGGKWEAACDALDKIFGTDCKNISWEEELMISEGLRQFDKKRFDEFDAYCKKHRKE